MSKLPEGEALRRRRERCRIYTLTHPKEKAAYNKRWVAQNRDRKRANNARWARRHRGKRAKEARNWRLRNPEKWRAVTKRSRQRLTHKLAAALRARIRSVLHGSSKSASTLRLLGCDLSFLMGYLEARFKPGMSWSNYGKVWHLDHHIPLASYDLSDLSHQRSAFHYSNLRPLFKSENLSKGAKRPPAHQAELL